VKETELKSIIDSYRAKSSSVDTMVDSGNADAWDYYFGKKYGNEVDGRSSVITRDVLEAIEWAMPDLMRVFASGDKFVEFDPTGPEDIEQAEQETDYVNHIIVKKNDGWKVLYDWFKGALLNMNSYVKTYIDESKRSRVTSHSGLSGDQLLAVSQDPESEVEELEEKVNEFGETVYDIKLRKTTTKKRIESVCVPMNELRIYQDWNKLSLDGCPFISHERKVPLSDLVAMGFDKDEVLESAGPSDSEEDTETESSRNRFEEESFSRDDEESQKRIGVSEVYVLVDYDDDGISEQRKIIKIGDKIFLNEEIDCQPFSTISPIPVPHRHVGMSYAELVMDLQLIRSTLIRQMLDNLYLTNNPEKEVVDGAASLEDLMISAPGAIKRVTMPGAIRELTVPFTAGQSMPMLDILDKMGEARTGVSRSAVGLDADVLAKSTRGAFLGALERSSQRIELVARTFAETGVKELFLKVHKLAISNMDKGDVIKMRGNFVPVNPNEWEERFDMTVVVGLGSGNRDQKLQQLQLIAEKQEQHMQNGSPLVEFNHLFNTYAQMLEIAGIKDPTRHFADPTTEEFMKAMEEQANQPPEPTEAEKIAMLQKEIEELKVQQRQQADMSKTQADMKKHDDKMELERDKLIKETQVDLTELELEYDKDVPGALV
jgi:hypothetical protein